MLRTCGPNSLARGASSGVKHTKAIVASTFPCALKTGAAMAVAPRTVWLLANGSQLGPNACHIRAFLRPYAFVRISRGGSAARL
jgi:hypothetical protein